MTLPSLVDMVWITVQKGNPEYAAKKVYPCTDDPPDCKIRRHYEYLKLWSRFNGNSCCS